MQCLPYNNALDDQIKKNYNTLLQLQIEHQTMQNYILKELLDKCIPINLPIVKYNKIVLNNNLINQAMIKPSPPPTMMYS
tara:strand:+ start:56 stop:295 length:240 start_codon:yes stop_codon:yes gene_type:complete